MTRHQDGSMSVDPVADASIDWSQIHASEPFRELDFVPAVILTGVAMLGYVVFGGKLATT
jgi:hypothetical protein